MPLVGRSQPRHARAP